MKILLLGKSGILGSYFDFSLKDFSVSVFSPSSEELNICDYSSVRKYLLDLKPDFVINCTGYTAVDDAETNKEDASKLNAEAVGELASSCKESDSILIHFSTDYVFDGENPDGYTEDSPVVPINVYGESKLEGEKLVANNMDKYFIVRTSWLFGRPEKDFVGTMLRLAKDRDELSVVTDQIGSPTFAGDLADAVIKNFVNVDAKPSFGVYHLTNSGVCSWYDFAEKIFELAQTNIKLNKVGSEAFPRPAKRPKCSVLLNTKLDFRMRPWGKALEEYIPLSLAKGRS